MENRIFLLGNHDYAVGRKWFIDCDVLELTNFRIRHVYKQPVYKWTRSSSRAARAARVARADGIMTIVRQLDS